MKIAKNPLHYNPKEMKHLPIYIFSALLFTLMFWACTEKSTSTPLITYSGDSANDIGEDSLEVTSQEWISLGPDRCLNCTDSARRDLSSEDLDNLIIIGDDTTKVPKSIIMEGAHAIYPKEISGTSHKFQIYGAVNNFNSMADSTIEYQNQGWKLGVPTHPGHNKVITNQFECDRPYPDLGGSYIVGDGKRIDSAKLEVFKLDNSKFEVWVVLTGEKVEQNNGCTTNTDPQICHFIYAIIKERK